MQLRFTIPELEAYLAEVFPETGGRYGVEEMRPGFLRVRMIAAAADLRPGGTVSGPAISRWRTAPSTWRRSRSSDARRWR